MHLLMFCHLCFGLNHIAIALVRRGQALDKRSTCMTNAANICAEPLYLSCSELYSPK